MAIDETQNYVDWAGLRYYDQRVKEYIDSRFNSSDDQNQFRADLEQLEDRIQTLADNFTRDKSHIYDHIEACKKSSATKEELKSAMAALREEIKTLTGVDLSEYATIKFVEDKIRDLSSVEIPEIPTKVSQLDNDSGFLTDIPEEYLTEEELDAKGYVKNLDGYATEDFVNQQFENFELPDLTNYATIDDVKGEVEKLVADAPEKLDTLNELAQAIEEQSEVLDTFATKSQLEGLASEQFVSEEISKIQIPDTSKFITTIPEEYVTDTELEEKGYLTEHQSLDGFATEQFVNNKLAELDCVTTDEVENIIDEKIEAAITEGATVSSISYGTF